MAIVTELAHDVGVDSACGGLGIPRATFYRQTGPRPQKARKPRPRPPRALSDRERQAVLDVLNSERFADKAPDEVYATLLDEGTYLFAPDDVPVPGRGG